MPSLRVHTDRPLESPPATGIGLLLAHGADVNIKDHNGDTPLDEAINSGHKDIVDLLRRYGTTP